MLRQKGKIYSRFDFARMHYTDLFIDFDDTLYDTHGNANIALAEIFDFFHLSNFFERLEDFTVPYWKANFELWTLYAHGRIGRDELMVERFRRPLSCGNGLSPTFEYCMQVSDKFLALCAEKPGTLPGAHELMQYLKDRGYHLHLASNGFREVQFKKLKASNMYQYFDTIILSEEVGANKPSPLFYEFALQKSGADRNHTLMIGDNQDTDIAGAHGVGLPQIWYNPHGLERSIDFIPTFTVRDLRDILHIL